MFQLIGAYFQLLAGRFSSQDFTVQVLPFKFLRYIIQDTFVHSATKKVFLEEVCQIQIIYFANY